MQNPAKNSQKQQVSEAEALHLPKYFDFAAATPVHPAVYEAMLPYFTKQFYNPSAQYVQARGVSEVLDRARSDVAVSLGAKPAEVVFTAGGSESASLAIRGVMNKPENSGKKVAILAIEHDAVLKNAENYNFIKLPVLESGLVNKKALSECLKDPDLTLLSIGLVNNEIGTIQPIREIAKMLQLANIERQKNGQNKVLLHTDACQAPLYVDVNVGRLGVDLMTLNGGKIYGPKQSGILYIKTGLQLEPQVSGGGQEFGLRSGTENVAFAVGFSLALKKAISGHKTRAKQTAVVRDYLISRLESEFSAEVCGSKCDRVANNILAIFDGQDNERLLISLDQKGFAVASGSACHASNGEPSNALKAIGITPDRAQSALRFSINEFSEKQDCDQLIDALKDVID